VSEPPRDDETAQLDPARFMRVGLLFYGALAVAAVVWREGFYDERVFDPPAAAVAGAGSAPGVLAAGLFSGAAVGLAVVLASFALTEFTAVGRRLSQALARRLPALGVGDAVLLAFASGLAEELFFRGALQPRVGLVAASLLFGALHVASERALVAWSLFAIAMGFLFGWLYEASGTLAAPIAAHTVINAVNLPLLARHRGAASR